MQPHEPVIVVIVPTRNDLDIVLRRHWYRLPLKHGPTEINAQWIAFYTPGSFGTELHGVHYYARINSVEKVRRIDLFPDQKQHPRANNHYFAVSFDPPMRLAKPLRPERGKRFIWSQTTLWRLNASRNFDELFSPEPLLNPEGDQLLVGVVPRERDLEIARLQRWYRIPTTVVRNWTTPNWVAFYLGRGFGSGAGQIRYFARVWHSDIVKRAELFPDQPRHPRAHVDYIRLHHDQLQERPAAIRSSNRRGLVLLPTTLDRFMTASDVNDLVIGDDVEESFYGSMKEAGMRPERAYYVRGPNAYHLADYAVFCRKQGIQIDIASNTMPKRLLVTADEKNPMPDDWRSLRLSRFDITQRRSRSLDRLREVVDACGGIVTT
jgi:hypothetical protein